MLLRRDDGFDIDTSPERLDVRRVHQWLSTDAYWALGRTVEAVTTSINQSLCFGVYAPDQEQIGFARMVTDFATFAWLCDVYIAPPARGAGLGSWLVQTAHDHIRGRGVNRILLATADAHDVYAKVGFTPLANPDRWMEIDLRPTGPRPSRRNPPVT